MIVKEGKKWVIKSETGKNLGVFDTKKEAEERLLQIEYFKQKSDLRLKTNVADLPKCLATLDLLRPVLFNFKGELSVLQAGFIAQEYINVFPDQTMNTDDGVSPLQSNRQAWEIDLSVLIPYLVGAVKELNAEITLLKGV